MSILVTGGAGFIGSHTCVELIESGYDVIVADNLYNSKALVIDRIEKIAGKRPKFYEIDVCDREALNDLFDKESIDAVIHFAGYKAVGESTRKPIEYYYNNLLPYVAKVAGGKLEMVHVFGNDYDTPDGTGVRDYIHVVDLAKGHVKAIEGMEKLDGVNIFNLGTGTGYSVLDIIKAFSQACGKEIPYVIDPRRPGDIATCYSDPSKAYEVLGWKAEKNLEDMCRDAWRWQSQNPDGYDE